jgi:tellurite resistance protein TehA-like permease
MATGILSGALALDGQAVPAWVLLGLGLAAWAALVAVVALRGVRDRDRILREARTPAALTAVAGTAVLGTRLVLVGLSGPGAALLAVAAALWAVLVARLPRPPSGATGTWLMLTVSTEALSIGAAVVGACERVDWLLAAALAPFATGLGLYLLVISRFDLRQLATGLGDQWITGGALAISALAAARIAWATRELGYLEGVAPGLRTAAVVLWGSTMAWFAVLAACELTWRRGRYDVRRWATVFPLGMSAAAAFVAGSVAAAPALTDFARVWVWAGFLVWLVVLAGAARRAIAIATD